MNRKSIASGVRLYSNPVVNNYCDFSIYLLIILIFDTCIIFNKEEIKKTCGYFNWYLIVGKKELFWLSSVCDSGGFACWLNCYDLKSNALSRIRQKHRPIPLMIDKIYGLVLLGFNEFRGSYTVYFLSNNFRELNKRKFTRGSVYLRDNNNLVDGIQVM